MAKLYFRYGAMGSSKTANALMVEYNYEERGKRALLVKPRLDNRDGSCTIRSRMGLAKECGFLDDLLDRTDEELRGVDCYIVDEAQFATKKQVEFLLHIVDDLDIPVICYGLRADFRNQPFEGSLWLLVWADSIEEVKTVCWCGRKATCNARIDASGAVVREGEQVVLGGNDKYTALCRKHLKAGLTGPAKE
jgi:thymidine kinase